MSSTASLQIQSHLSAEGRLTLALGNVPLPAPGPDEVVLKVEAAPINPSDLGAMFGPADISKIRLTGSGAAKQASMLVPQTAMPALATRVGENIPAGIEGAGVVIAAGSSPEAQTLLGRVAAVSIGGMYTQYRVAKLEDLLVMREGTTSQEAASSFINPLTALGMVETLRREGHSAIVHTAAASNLGQMLNRLCLADGIPLVNIVRNAAQEEILASQGAEYVLNSTSSDFAAELEHAIEATGATLCFDAIGGGRLISRIFTAMEATQVAKLPGYQRYGSTIHKQAYVYGMLDLAPIELTRSFGSAWGVSGWLLTQYLARLDPKTVQALKARIAREITTTFASRYAKTISLHDALEPSVIAEYHKRATGEKYLITPHA